MTRTWLVAGAAVATVLQGCGGHSCSSVGRFGLSVRVQDSRGAAVCEAVVSATDGDYSEVLSAGTANDCVFIGALERRGTYTVTATLGGITGSISGVKVRADVCHVITQVVTVKLGA